MSEEIARQDGEMVPPENSKVVFIESLKACRTVSVAAQLAGISRQEAYFHRRTDDAFRKAWDSAFEEGRDVLLQRALDLSDRDSPYYDPKNAPRMLMFLLKGHPSVQREPQAAQAFVNVTINGNSRPISSLKELTDQELQQIVEGDITIEGDETILYDDEDEFEDEGEFVG
jgi:hypothetical protein